MNADQWVRLPDFYFGQVSKITLQSGFPARLAAGTSISAELLIHRKI